jgi:hypothetical protein
MTVVSGPQCHLCGSPALGVFRFSRGCLCDPATVQPLCWQHAVKSRPAGGGSMELVEDLTTDGGFAAWWGRHRAGYSGAPRL